ncbi:MAG TPA: hypothetical protein ACHBYN_08575 [Arsenophonus nasoniae]|uniref:hypothetical protein n=1 Tax=Arsenophonus nasoniae TaxID=638 RepID=UPI00387A42B5
MTPDRITLINHAILIAIFTAQGGKTIGKYFFARHAVATDPTTIVLREHLADIFYLTAAIVNYQYAGLPVCPTGAFKRATVIHIE